MYDQKYTKKLTKFIYQVTGIDLPVQIIYFKRLNEIHL